MTTITPTHSCFDDMLALLDARVKERSALAFGRSLRLVHGILLCPPNGSDESLAPDAPFAHAWIEDETQDGEPIVWQSGILDDHKVAFAIPRAEFLIAMRPQAQTAYTCREVWREHSRTGTSGPWRPEYLALCRRDVDAMAAFAGEQAAKEIGHNVDELYADMTVEQLRELYSAFLLDRRAGATPSFCDDRCRAIVDELARRARG